jgi:ABC-2 type transport system ATP-binding protein
MSDSVPPASPSVATGDVVLSAKNLRKQYNKPFSRVTVDAVRGISFDVHRGEIFGFLGPNGAGKTTTIKMLVGLMAATSGEATVLGAQVPSPEALGKVGFLPENPYVYPYLTPREFVELCGRLNGLGGAHLRKRTEEVLAKLGIADAADRPARTMSKGMLQRTGLAAALVHEPELLLLDEPMSGLDPVGRKEVRDLILAEREAGRTVFFSSHVLADVELLCDRVCILKKGEVVVSGAIAELLHTSDSVREVVFAGDATGHAALQAVAPSPRRLGDTTVYEVGSDDALRKLLTAALAESDLRLIAVTPKRETLEDLFVRRAL